jgi:hypothetical protein
MRLTEQTAGTSPYPSKITLNNAPLKPRTLHRPQTAPKPQRKNEALDEIWHEAENAGPANLSTYHLRLEDMGWAASQ